MLANKRGRRRKESESEREVASMDRRAILAAAWKPVSRTIRSTSARVPG